MKILIEQRSNGWWLASRAGTNTLLSSEQLYKFLVAKKQEGFSISFKMASSSKAA